MKQIHAYKMDLTRIEGKGDFPCPKCGANISPEDEKEDTYSILGSKANDDGLEEIIIRCNKCSCQIHITGFALLQNLPNMGHSSLSVLRVEAPILVDHV